jgi:hypothetical protein
MDFLRSRHTFAKNLVSFKNDGMASPLLNSGSELSFILSSKGMGAFSRVTGGRASSFQDLSMGEAAAPPKVENVGGGKTPPRISPRKDPTGRLGTKEKVPMPCPIVVNLTMPKLLNVSKNLEWLKALALVCGEVVGLSAPACAGIFMVFVRGVRIKDEVSEKQNMKKHLLGRLYLLAKTAASRLLGSLLH